MMKGGRPSGFGGASHIACAPCGDTRRTGLSGLPGMPPVALPLRSSHATLGLLATLGELSSARRGEARGQARAVAAPGLARTLRSARTRWVSDHTTALPASLRRSRCPRAREEVRSAPMAELRSDWKACTLAGTGRAMPAGTRLAAGTFIPGGCGVRLAPAGAAVDSIPAGLAPGYCDGGRRGDSGLGAPVSIWSAGAGRICVCLCSESWCCPAVCKGQWHPP